MVQLSETPTVKMPAQKPAPMRLFGIKRGDVWLSSQAGIWDEDAIIFTWRGAHRFLADHPEYEDAQVVAIVQVLP